MSNNETKESFDNENEKDNSTEEKLGKVQKDNALKQQPQEDFDEISLEQSLSELVNEELELDDENASLDISQEETSVEEASDQETADEEASDEGTVEEETSDVNSEDNPKDEQTEDNLEEVEEELTDINATLASQISDELAAMDELNKKKLKWFKIKIGIGIGLICIIFIGMFLGLTPPGRRILKAMGGKIWAISTKEFDDGETVPDRDVIEPDDIEKDLPEIDTKDIIWNIRSGNGRREDHVYNILILGEEAIAPFGSRGRTDLIIIASLNKTEKKVKLTSLMRDTLVQIPGFQDNKLNSAYERGGIKLLYETIELNFDIKLDGSVMVNFENFEKIIDRLGGLELTLTRTEARYLNSTNFISNPNYRNVREGTQRMNGNQVLGYSRIRHRAASTGRINDFGRTDRHRIILNALFDKYHTKNKAELFSIMVGVLPMLTTDIDSKGFELLLDTFLEIGITEIEDLRLPADGAFTENVKVRGMEVLIPDLEKNVEILHKFVFGE